MELKRNCLHWAVVTINGCHIVTHDHEFEELGFDEDDIEQVRGLMVLDTLFFQKHHDTPCTVVRLT